MEDIIQPIERSVIKAELTKERFLRPTGNGSNELYVINHINAPNTMKEIGRLREVSFRNAGGGTGKSVDIDEFDMHPEYPYQQLLVWNPDEQDIIGGYRFVLCKDTLDKNGNFNLATTELFTFSEKFKKEYSPYVLELGRSFVQPKYQSRTAGKKGLYALDNLWDGLGAIITENPWVKYFYGKVTMYGSFNKFGRDLILYFMDKHFGDREGLVTPKEPLTLYNKVEDLAKILVSENAKEDMKLLQQYIRSINEIFPPLISSYINLSSTTKTFGTALNAGFGMVEETGMLVTIGDIYPERVERYIVPYKKFKGYI